jgi:hypothetical protein
MVPSRTRKALRRRCRERTPPPTSLDSEARLPGSCGGSRSRARLLPGWPSRWQPLKKTGTGHPRCYSNLPKYLAAPRRTFQHRIPTATATTAPYRPPALPEPVLEEISAQTRWSAPSAERVVGPATRLARDNGDAPSLRRPQDLKRELLEEHQEPEPDEADGAHRH